MSSDSSSDVKSEHCKRHKHKKKYIKKDRKSKKRTKSKTHIASHEKVKTTIFTLEKINEQATEESTFGPVLPPHLLRKELEEKKDVLIGPILPNLKSEEIDLKEKVEIVMDFPNEESKNEDTYGPIPLDALGSMTEHHIQLEERALKMKIAGIEGSLNPRDHKSREEWMLELPEIGIKNSLPTKRKFHQGKEKPDFSDRSCWTKTPSSKDEPSTSCASKITTNSIRNAAQACYNYAHDIEQERIASKHKNKRKKEQSLYVMHVEKTRKEKKQKIKEEKAKGCKPERRPFNREEDMKLNKVDKNQTKQIVNKAKILNTKFAAGQRKYL